jgi:DNA-binding response OmpR family regulator
MAVGICLISAENQSTNELREMLTRCGMEVWTPQSLNEGDGHIYQRAVCLVIDMPQGSSLRTLRLFRAYGISTPALLIVDPGTEVDPITIDCPGIMDVVPRGVSPLRILRWVQSICAAAKLLKRRNQQVDQLHDIEQTRMSA